MNSHGVTVQFYLMVKAGTKPCRDKVKKTCTKRTNTTCSIDTALKRNGGTGFAVVYLLCVSLFWLMGLPQAFSIVLEI